ncbi:DAK2 domain-containing protein [Azospirillum sp. ST 5-10]|uniref:DAK2 domain-containing protein n=1 Tax=unclassified Azospirillum TaxID=2630922 RepID=UPI003F4A2F91
MLTSSTLARALAGMNARAAEVRDRLNAADSRLGDGDTGMTVARIVEAMHAAVAEPPADVGLVLAACSRACSQASGSSLASVVAIGLMAAAKAARGREAVDRPGVAQLLQAAVEAIAARSGAAPGDKSVLDSVVAVQAALASEAGAGAPLAVAAAAAGSALDAFRDRESRLGRARVYGAKSVGHDDPGMLAACLLLAAAQEPPEA